jgi:photosystem II stability/assembly factor-like uncharacterized protein
VARVPKRSRPSAKTGSRKRAVISSLVFGAFALVAAVGAFALGKREAEGPRDAVAPPARGLPATPDYHSLHVDPESSRRLLLGTHVGVYESVDGGVSWRFAALEGKDAMHFAQEDDGTVWAAGHNVLERSADGGRTWAEVRPEGLPGLDIHGFAVSQDVDGLVYAAVAGEGLYRSDDGGATFREISTDVGPGVYALAVTKDGVLLAADAERGVLVNANGDGVEWAEALDMPTVGLATNRLDPPRTRILAAGRSVQLSADRGTWKQVLDDQSGPVAFAPGNPELAYAVGFDRVLYRSNDGGETWSAVR